VRCGSPGSVGCFDWIRDACAVVSGRKRAGGHAEGPARSVGAEGDGEWVGAHGVMLLFAPQPGAPSALGKGFAEELKPVLGGFFIEDALEADLHAGAVGVGHGTQVGLDLAWDEDGAEGGDEGREEATERGEGEVGV